MRIDTRSIVPDMMNLMIRRRIEQQKSIVDGTSPLP